MSSTFATLRKWRDSYGRGQMHTHLPAWAVAVLLTLIVATVLLMVVAPAAIPVITATSAVIGGLAATLSISRDDD